MKGYERMQPETRRALLIKACIELVRAHHGDWNVATRIRIAAEAGVTVGTISRYFGTHRGCQAAAVQRMYELGETKEAARGLLQCPWLCDLLPVTIVESLRPVMRELI